MTVLDVPAIRSFVDSLTTTNFKAVFTSKNAVLDEAEMRTEPIYSTCFVERLIDAELLARLESFLSAGACESDFAGVFSLPRRNRFVATDFAMKYKSDFDAVEAAPVLVHDEEGLVCYFNQTRRFDEPVGTVILYICSPAVYSTFIEYFKYYL